MSDTTHLSRSENQETKLNLKTKVVSKGILIGFISLLLGLIIVLISAYSTFKPKYNQFLSAANLNHEQFINLLQQVQQQDPDQILGQDQKLTLLILGIDSLAQRKGSPPLTDTLLLAQIDLTEANITTISLPRDLWSEAYQTKINALYTYGFERYPDHPEKFSSMVLEQLTMQEIDRTMVISLEQLGLLIDLIGGIEINIKQSFIDPKFPRTDVDVTNVSDPNKLYETIEFKQGLEHMSGERALKFIRSRHSLDEAGNDLDRNSRQQQVINSLISKMSQTEIYWQQPQLAGKLFEFYQQNIAQYFEISDLMTVGYNLGSKLSQLEFSAYTLPVYPDNEDGIIIHPEPSPKYQNQWIYLLKDKDEFASYIQKKLN